MANFEWILTDLWSHISNNPRFRVFSYCAILGAILVCLSLEFKLNFMRENPLETKSKDTDKNLRIETAKFQTGLDTAKHPFHLFCNSAVCIENKAQVYLRITELWEEKGRTSKQIQFVKKRCKRCIRSTSCSELKFLPYFTWHCSVGKLRTWYILGARKWKYFCLGNVSRTCLYPV